METEKSLLKTNVEENRKKQLAQSALVLSKWFEKWLDAFPSHGVTTLQQLVYLEALDDLTPNQIELGCREATRTAEVFPKPGHIRNALKKVQSNDVQVLGPPLLEYDPPTPEEKAEREEWRRFYADEDKQERSAPPDVGPRFKFKKPTLTIDEQKRVLREKGLIN